MSPKISIPQDVPELDEKDKKEAKKEEKALASNAELAKQAANNRHARVEKAKYIIGFWVMSIIVPLLVIGVMVVAFLLYAHNLFYSWLKDESVIKIELIGGYLIVAVIGAVISEVIKKI